jgi:hypothetical protein
MKTLILCIALFAGGGSDELLNYLVTKVESIQQPSPYQSMTRSTDGRSCLIRRVACIFWT